MSEITLGKKTISSESKKPFVIAEIGVNHEGSIDRAKKLIDDAIEGGADAVKFQAYKADTIAVVKSPAYWDQTMEPTTSQFELFKKHDSFNFKEFETLARYAEKQGTIFCCTPFDFKSADFLNELMPFYKISSSDITNFPFIRHIAKKDKPIILSTGASTLGEIDAAVRVIQTTAKVPLSLLHCVLNYPCPPSHANLDAIRLLKNTYPDLCIGYSDHVLADAAMQTLTFAYITGAVIIEKHFTDDKTLKGNDHLHSMTKGDLKVFFKNVEMYHELKGQYRKDYLSLNESSARLNARRSIVSARPIKQGEKITWDMISFKRPAHGISPSLVDYIVGSEATCTIEADTPLQFEHLKSLTSPNNTPV